MGSEIETETPGDALAKFGKPHSTASCDVSLFFAKLALGIGEC